MTPRLAMGRMLTLALLAAAIGCEETGPEGPGSKVEAPSAQTPEVEPPDPNDPIAVAVHELGKKHAPGMIPAGDLHRDRIAEGELRDYQIVLKGGRCYRAVAAGMEGVTDLDLLLLDAHGLPQLQEAETSAEAILGKEEAFCVEMPGLYRLQVKMWKGGGEFGARFYRSP